jgi:hypothetical protein
MSCPVCFNASAADESVRTSLNLGILVLLGVTGVVLAGFLRFIVSIARLSKADLSQADPKVRLYSDNIRPESAVIEPGLQARLPV